LSGLDFIAGKNKTFRFGMASPNKFDLESRYFASPANLLKALF